MKSSRLILIVFLLLIAFPQYAQNKGNKKLSIKGYVMDGGGKPVANTVFLADDLQLNARSNQDGYFRLKTLISTEKLTAISLEYGAIEIPVTGQDSMIFIFQKDPELSQEELAEAYPDVDFEFGKIRQSPGENSAGDLDGSKYTSIYELIQAELPGVQVQGKNITVRQGQASFDPNASFDPLIILNGVPTTSIANVHPSDVKSVELLKGTDASFYGSRGTNGVIIIQLR
jgi:hypothetical protein